MTAALEVVDAGLHTTVQDRGRRGYQDIGVPVSGPLDRIGFQLANALVGNPRDASALELLVLGPTLRVLADSARVALAGCGATLEIRSGATRRIGAGESTRVVRGDVIRVGALGASMCATLAVEGGIGVAPVLGSRSTYVRGAIGGHEGRRLVKGDLLPLNLERVPDRAERALREPLDLALDRPIRVVPGPQRNHFTDSAFETLLDAEYVVSPQADRMGFRLTGPKLAHADGYNIVSDGIVSGSIQVPGSGLPIILMVDNQTTGGYPKIATVVSADLPVVGRRKPGRPIRFAVVDVHEAEALRREQESALRAIIDGMRTVEKPV